MDFGQVTQASATDRHISSDKSDFNVHLICTDQRYTLNFVYHVLCQKYIHLILATQLQFGSSSFFDTVTEVWVGRYNIEPEILFICNLGPVSLLANVPQRRWARRKVCRSQAKALSTHSGHLWHLISFYPDSIERFVNDTVSVSGFIGFAWTEGELVWTWPKTYPQASQAYLCKGIEAAWTVIKGTQRLFSVKYLFEEANIA